MSRQLTVLVFLIGAPVLFLSVGRVLVADPPDVKPLKLDHKTLDLDAGPDEGWLRFEVRATIAGDRGEGTLRITRFNPFPGNTSPEPLLRDLFGDRTGEEKPTSTDHKVTLKRVKSKDDLPTVRRALEVSERKNKNSFVDPSPKGDRKIYTVEGPDYGTNRGLVLMVSPGGVHRLIYFARYGGPYALTLEPRDSFDGPVKGDKQ
jgi:hypothetical protein